VLNDPFVNYCVRWVVHLIDSNSGKISFTDHLCSVAEGIKIHNNNKNNKIIIEADGVAP
jgi:hypothetical protein